MIKPAIFRRWSKYSREAASPEQQRDRATSRERNFIEQIKPTIFLEGVSAKDAMQEFQSNLEEQEKKIVSLDFQPQSTVSRRSDSSSKANSSCCHRSDAWSRLE